MLRKGQAAMEFLMTYGWAILVVLIAIGALAYFGVFNLPGLLPKKCLAPAGFSCGSDYKFTATSPGTVTLEITNNQGSSITMSALYIDINNDGTWTAAPDCDNTDAQLTPGILTDGQTYSAVFDTCPNWVAGQKIRGSIRASYTIGSGPSHTFTGSISGQAEA